MPELLWACLLRAVLPPHEALQAFRIIAKLALELRGSTFKPHQTILTHTNLAAHHPQFIESIVRIISGHPLGYAALRPLLLFESLPGREHWAAAIGTEATEDDCDTLTDAIIEYLNHQSDQSTDVRWLICLFPTLAGKVLYFEGLEEIVEEMRLYPTKGDVGAVRASIRSKEQAMWMSMEGELWPPWCEQFWRECLDRAPCMLADPVLNEKPLPSTDALGPVVAKALDDLSLHYMRTLSTSAVDAEHEASFAFLLYSMRCLIEMLLGRTRQRIGGRLFLRTVVECRITLAYLFKMNDPQLWVKFRHYGAGQTKLALLKMAEASQQPRSIPLSKLEQLANEDMWDEFVNINLGHWANVDLRKMAEVSDTKDVYDALYGWPSAHIHGQWSALRDSTLTTCLNPLHRLHRVPLVGRRDVEDTVPDTVALIEAMLVELLNRYPGAEISLSVPLTDT